jgi:hypothetical protein
MIMRRGVQVLFLLFYVASSYAVYQERTRLIVIDFQHSSTRGSMASIEPGFSKLDVDFPNYRQAKPKSICALCLVSLHTSYFLPAVSERVFHSPSRSLKSLHVDSSVLSRAPPLQS